MKRKKKNMRKNNRGIQHPLFGTSIINWIKLVTNNGGVDPSFFPRAMFVTISALLTMPARFLFKIVYGPRIADTKIKYPPVFIIGHWRSGTTFLHELLSHDPQFCYVSMWHTLLPNSFLVMEPTKKFMAQFLPTTRPMDNIEVAVDGPYEEEAGLAVLGQWSFFHCFHFPRYAKRQYSQSIHFEELTDEDVVQWKKNYFDLMKAVTYSNHGKRLVLKNPPNTARITTLMELFPDARFIHIYRNPYKVYLSTKRMRTKVLDKLALQHTTDEQIENHVIDNYIRLMKSYFKQKDQIPDGHLIEIRYEDLVADPMGQIREVYARLGLPSLEVAKPKMQCYLDEKAGYKKNVYEIDDAIIRRVKKHWDFTIKRWGYEPPK